MIRKNFRNLRSNHSFAIDGAGHNHVAVFLLGCGLAVSIAVMTMAATAKGSAADTDPMTTVKATVGQALDVLKNRSTPQEARRRQLIETVAGRFDFADMARSTLGYHWRELTRAQRNEFVPLFTAFMEDAYLSKLDSYSGQQIEFKGETRPEPGYAEVRSTVLQPSGVEPIGVDYQLKNENGDWKVSDVTIDHISITANYRNQFDHVINDRGYDALVNAMKSKQQELSNSLASS
jgi:phospholipid transport system substrate-binding protein